MLDVQEFLIPLDKTRALIVSDSEWGIEEMEGLLVTLGGEPIGRGEDGEVVEGKSHAIEVVLRKIDPGTYIGKGKLDELKRIIESGGLDLMLVDFELSPSQMKAIEQHVGKLVIDRSGVILEIFNRHARTKEAKLQVEIARLEYLMPRLTRMWTHFERQSGSGGGAGGSNRGMGEKQIEVDRRLVKDRILSLKKKLREVESSRGLQRRGRDDLLKVALVGYTNAGKSTLLNKLTHSDVLVEDALFATLDASVRLLNPKSKPIVLAIDTVGFIDRLPHGLVASFRSTLGEVLEADLLVHTLDASHPEVRRHYEVTMEVLKELGADAIPMQIVMNKMDLCTQPHLIKIWAKGVARELGDQPDNKDSACLRPDAPIFVSALEPSDVDALREKILKIFESRMEVYEVMIPFEDGKTAAKLHELGRVEKKTATEQGLFFRVKTLPAFAAQLNLEKYRI